MKYGRTEDGQIIKIDEKGCIEVFNNRLYAFSDKTLVYRCENGREIIEEADSIEELCDEFVFINKIGKFDKSYVIYYEMPNHIFTEPTIEEKITYIKKHYYEVLNRIKGAIYTDKGLIYVAKMNNKGELELLWN